MSISEKRYFKLFCTAFVGQSNYLSLFTAIAQQDQYDESAIKQQFAGEKFIQQLHVTKHYLSQLILKSLRNFHAKITKEAEVLDLLKNVEILYHRDLYPHCFQELMKAEKLTLRYENLAGYLQVLQWKRRLLLSWSSKNQGSLPKVETNYQETLRKLQTIGDYWQMAVNIAPLLQTPDGKEPLLSHPLLTEAPSDIPLKSNTLRAGIQYNIHLFEKDFDEAEAVIQKAIQKWELQPLMIKNDPISLISLRNNLTGLYFYTKNYEKVKHSLEQTKSIPKKYQLNLNKLTIKVLLRTYNMELEFYRDNKMLKDGIRAVSEAEAFFTQHLAAISEDYRLRIWFQSANLHFLNKNFGEALTWVNKILNSRFQQASKMLFRYTYLLNLLVHFELENFMVLRYFIGSYKRKYKGKKQLGAFEKILLRFLTKTSRLASSDVKPAFQKLKLTLFLGEKTLVNKNTLDFIDLEFWINERTNKYK